MDDLLHIAGGSQAPPERPMVHQVLAEGNSSWPILDVVKKAYVHRPKSASTPNVMPWRSAAGPNPPAGFRRVESAARTAARKIRLPQNLLFKRYPRNVQLLLAEEPGRSAVETFGNSSTTESAADEDIDDGQADMTFPAPAIPPATALLPFEGQKRKHSGDHDDEYSRGRPKSKCGLKAGSNDLQRKPSAKENNQGILDWMNNHPEAAELIRCGASSSEQLSARDFDSGVADVQPNVAHEGTQLLGSLESLPLRAEKLLHRISTASKAGSCSSGMRSRFLAGTSSV